LTSISISTIIDWNLASGQLHAFDPRSPAATKYRQLYLAEQLKEELYREDRGRVELRRFAKLEATLELFVTRKHIPSNFLKGLLPKGCGVWEIKCWEQPAIRVFGMFMHKDLFVVTHCAYRDDLGSIGSPEWIYEARRCEKHISDIFHTFSPMTSSDVNKVISGALDENYFKN